MDARGPLKSSRIQSTITASLLTLKVVKEIAQAANVPYLDGLAGIAELIIQTAQDARSNKEDAAEFARHMSELAQGICMGWKKSTEAKREVLDFQVRELCRALESVCADLQAVTKHSSTLKRLLYAQEDKNAIIKCRERLRDAEMKFSTLALVEIWQSTVPPGVELTGTKAKLERKTTMLSLFAAKAPSRSIQIGKGQYHIASVAQPQKVFTGLTDNRLVQAWRTGFYGTDGLRDWTLSPSKKNPTFYTIKHAQSESYVSVQSTPGAFGVYLVLSNVPYEWNFERVAMNEENFVLRTTTGDWVADLFANLTDIGLWTYNGGKNQQWCLIPALASSAPITPEDPLNLITGARALTTSPSPMQSLSDFDPSHIAVEEPELTDDTNTVQIPEGVYQISSPIHSMLRMWTGASNGAAPVRIRKPDPGNMRDIFQFTISPFSSPSASTESQLRFHTIRHQPTGMYVSVQHPPGHASALLVLAHKPYGWAFERAPVPSRNGGKPCYFIRNFTGDWVADLLQTGSRMNIGLWEYHGGINQQWVLNPAVKSVNENSTASDIIQLSAGQYRIYTTIREASVLTYLDNGLFEVQHRSSRGGAEEMTLTPKPGAPGVYTISMDTGEYVSVQEPPGSELLRLVSSKTPYEWTFESAPYQSITIWNSTNEWVVDLFAGQTEVGLHGYHGGINQMWRLEAVEHQ